jgi:DNA-binding NtrC family response regulator
VFANILVVDEETASRGHAVDALLEAGYRVSAAHTFADAKAIMGAQPPTLLITAVRLGPFNGLHLVAFGRAHNAQMAAILCGKPVDAGLAADASRLGAAFIEQPLNVNALLNLVARALEPTAT